MSVVSWLQNLGARLKWATPGDQAIATRFICRCRLEMLEERSVPAVIIWDGGGDGSNWRDAANWVGDVLPGPNDHAIIDKGANDFTVVHSDGFDSVDRLTCRASLTLSGGSLKFLSQDYASFVDGTFTFTGGAIIISPGTLQSGSALVVNGSAFITGRSTADSFGVGDHDVITWTDGIANTGTIIAKGPTTLLGGLGIDTLTGTGTWRFVGSDAGNLNGIAFIGIEQLNCAAGGNEFRLQSGVPFGGTIAAGGSNTLNYSDSLGPLSIDLGNSKYPFLPPGFVGGIGGVTGTPSAEDTVFGPNGPATWSPGPLGPDSVLVNNVLLRGIEHLVGGAGADTFVIIQSVMSLDPVGQHYSHYVASLDGGAGINRLVCIQEREDFDVVYVAGLVINFQDGNVGRVADSFGLPVVDTFRNITAIEPFPFYSNTMIGPDAGAKWVAGTSGVTVADVRITGVQTLIGGSGADLFTVSGSFQLAERLTIYGMAGDDDIQATGGIDAPMWLYGGVGNDRLKGGAADDVLLGGEGNDLLTGGGGRDLLIGGTGADRIVGNADDDILIAGLTSHDGNGVALKSVMSEWTRTDRSYSQRISNLMSGNGHNGAIVLNGTTVFADGSADILTGSAGLDWFIFDDAEDTVTDLNHEAFINDLNFING